MAAPDEAPRDYRQSIAYLRSSARLRPDGRPLWPLRSEDFPSRFASAAAHSRGGRA